MSTVIEIDGQNVWFWDIIGYQLNATKTSFKVLFGFGCKLHCEPRRSNPYECFEIASSLRS
ncbi:hypothetical protein ACFLTZ_07220, partial [Chloroflexota bacterium]